MKREPDSVNYEVYGTNGSMETQRFGEKNLYVYLENGKVGHGSIETYIPEKFVSRDLAAKFGGHGGSDFFATHFFIQSILGRPEGKKYGINVYQAVDMTITGILAYRSCLNGGKPVRIPNLKNREERDAFRNDNACTAPEVAGDQLLPIFAGIQDMPKAPPQAYEHIRRLFQEGKKYTEYKEF
jgi:hypothetical protein